MVVYVTYMKKGINTDRLKFPTVFIMLNEYSKTTGTLDMMQRGLKEVNNHLIHLLFSRIKSTSHFSMYRH